VSDLSLKRYPRDELRERFARLGLPRYRADQVFAWVYERGVEDPDQMTDLPAALRRDLREKWSWRPLRLEARKRSRDGTVKGRLRTVDGALIESVLIPEGGRITVCISTQVGCPLACSFCATGAMGFFRNLKTEEIVDQVCRMRGLSEGGQNPTHVVFMGMGEPLLNLPAVVRAIRIFQEPRGLALGPRRITVSTAGVVPKIGALLEQVNVNLAISLHATTDALRDQLVPLNRRFPLAQLLGELRANPHFSRRHPVFFEYTMIAGRNDAQEDALRLVQLLRGIPAKVNLIPMNPHAASDARPSSREVVGAFAAVLARHGLVATKRRPRGDDIDAACGQLAGAA